MRETVKIRMLAFRVLTFNRAMFEKCQNAQRRKTLFCGRAVREPDEKKAQGIGMFTVDGKMIDIAFCDGAKRTLAPARPLESIGGSCEMKRR